MCLSRLVDDVFVLTGYPKYTYVERDKIDMSMEAALHDKGTHIYIVGESKFGKSSLWQKHLKSGQYIEPIRINRETNIQSLYNDILNRAQSFILVNTSENETKSETIKVKHKTGIPNLLESQLERELTESEDKNRVHERVGKVCYNINMLIDCLRDYKPRIILEDFHFASDEFVKQFADDLKSLSDEKIQIIIVGVENKIPVLFNERPDLQERILTIEVGHFEDKYLEEIIEKGSDQLNFEVDDIILKFIIKESGNKAYITQNICKHLCMVENIKDRCIKRFTLENMNSAQQACELVAFKNKPQYEKVVHVIGTKQHGNSTYDTYKWILKYLVNNKVNKLGVKLNELHNGIKALGNMDIPQTSIYACVPRLPKLLDKDKLKQVFKYENKTLFVDDSFQFFLRWSPNIVGIYIDNLKA